MSKFLCDTHSLPHTILYFLSAWLQLSLVLGMGRTQAFGWNAVVREGPGQIGSKRFPFIELGKLESFFFFLLSLFCFSSGSLLCLLHKRTQDCDSFISERLWYQKEHPLLGKMIFPFTSLMTLGKSLMWCIKQGPWSCYFSLTLHESIAFMRVKEGTGVRSQATQIFYRKGCHIAALYLCPSFNSLFLAY